MNLKDEDNTCQKPFIISSATITQLATHYGYRTTESFMNEIEPMINKLPKIVKHQRLFQRGRYPILRPAEVKYVVDYMEGL